MFLAVFSDVGLLSLTFAVFSCVLFLGSAIMCMASIQPQTNGVPLVSLIGFILSVALGLYAVQRMLRHG